MELNKRLISALLTAVLLAMPIQSFAATQYTAVNKTWRGSYAEPPDSVVVPTGATILFRGAETMEDNGNDKPSLSYYGRVILYSYDDGAPTAASLTAALQTPLNSQTTAINNNTNTQLASISNTLNTNLSTKIDSKVSAVINVPKTDNSILTKYGISTTVKTDGIYLSSDGNRYKVVFYDLPTSIAQLNLS